MKIFQKGDSILRSDQQFPKDALVVDGYDSDGTLLAFPFGGGFQLRIPPAEIEKFDKVTDGERTPIYREAEFTMEDLEMPFQGWTDGRAWNGWEMPLFRFADAQRVLDAMRIQWRYDESMDAFVSETPSGIDEQEVWEGKTIELPDGGSTKGYPVGAGSWMWDIVE